MSYMNIKAMFGYIKMNGEEFSGAEWIGMGWSGME